jgi:predicted permease
MLTILSAIFPTFALIILGIILRRKWFNSDEFWKYSEKMAYFILFPALIIRALSQTSFKNIEVSGLMGSLIACTILITAGLIIVQRRIKLEGGFFSSMVQGSIRYSSYILMSMTEILYGKEGIAIMAVIMAYMLIITNMISVMTINIYVNEKMPNPVNLLKQFIKNPLILACIIGILMSYSGIRLGYSLEKFMNYLGQGALPISLICVGATLTFGMSDRKWLFIMITMGIKLLLFPLLTVLLMWIFGVKDLSWKIGVLYASLPIPANAYILAKQTDADHESMATMVTVSTFASVITMTIMLSIF